MATSVKDFRRADVEVAGLARALSHPARVAILRLLAERRGCICGEIVDELPLAQATVSQHLKVLKSAGLVEGEVEGPRTCYCLSPGARERMRAGFQHLLAPFTPSLTSIEEDGT